MTDIDEIESRLIHLERQSSDEVLRMATRLLDDARALRDVIVKQHDSTYERSYGDLIGPMNTAVTRLDEVRSARISALDPCHDERPSYP